MGCPRCDGNLCVENYEGVAVDRCDVCNGVWLDEKEIVEIVTEREIKFSKEDVLKVVQSRKGGVPISEQKISLSCPRCKEEMESFNYGVDSSIILDRCKKSCGLWFDKSELEKVQMYREHWESQANKMGSEWDNLLQNSKVINSDKVYKGTLSPFKLLVNLLYK